ncbi:MAG: GFA family protein [Chthoniobacterales bacterium]
MNMSVEGGCLCGGVRYRLRTEPAQVSDCHCIDCRRASAASFVTWGQMKSDDIELLSGNLRKVKHASRLRSFAECCGTPLFFQDDENSRAIDVTIASLDDPEKFIPQAAIWTEDRMPWSVLDPARPAYPQGRDSTPE